jgi:hypothetical protein
LKPALLPANVTLRAVNEPSNTAIPPPSDPVSPLPDRLALMVELLSMVSAFAPSE